MRFLKDIWDRIAWKLWGRRRAATKFKRLVNLPPPTDRNADIYKSEISQEDMHLDHYKRMGQPR